MPAHDDLREGLRLAYTEIMAEFAPGITDIVLQVEDPEPDEESDGFKTVYTLHGGWLFEKTKRQPSISTDIRYQENYVLQVAEESDELAEAIAGNDENQGATHVLIGTKRYILNRPDIVPPSFIDPFWCIYCDHEFV